MKKYLLFICSLFAISYSLKAELCYDTSKIYLTSELTEKTTYDYYPYGKVLRKFELSPSRYLSTDHEKDSETGYDDRNARWYDDESLNFLQTDLLAPYYPSFSPYHYVGRNPIMLTDPTGMSWFKHDESGATFWDESTDKTMTRNKQEFKNIGETMTNSREHNGYRWDYTGNSDGTISVVASKIADREGATISNTVQERVRADMTLPQVNLMTGENTNPRRGFDIDRAINTLNDNARANSSGYCARYVRFALESGGINTNGRPSSATNYVPFLQNRGFREVEQEDYVPRIGDIVVMRAFRGTRNHPHGHIQMFNGTGWVSDFRQRDFWPGRDYRNYQPQTTILRW